MSKELISNRYSLDDINAALDRVAEEIEANPNGQSLIPIFQWLEDQLEARKLLDSTMERVRKRAATARRRK
ncbi:hypothetical protein M8R20_16625 [Pseudomonas sp. R2.Fl]|nr:hypothetical protein [Pseudomonas sp. R2.Fl]